MEHFADTSFLCALYRKEENTDRATAFIQRHRNPIFISPAVAFEFRQSIRLQVFRFANDRKQGISEHEAAVLFEKFSANLNAGAVKILPADWAEVYQTAEKWSAASTGKHGHRTMDILHVATALCGKIPVFLTFDRNQAMLAKIAGLTVKP